MLTKQIFTGYKDSIILRLFARILIKWYNKAGNKVLGKVAKKIKMIKNKIMFRDIVNHMCQRRMNLNSMLLHYKIPLFYLKLHKGLTVLSLLRNVILRLIFTYLRMFWSQEMTKDNRLQFDLISIVIFTLHFTIFLTANVYERLFQQQAQMIFKCAPSVTNIFLLHLIDSSEFYNK